QYARHWPGNAEAPMGQAAAAGPGPRIFYRHLCSLRRLQSIRLSEHDSVNPIRVILHRTAYPAFQQLLQEWFKKKEDGDAMKTLIIIPAYNEEGSIGSVIADIRRHVPEADIIVINDGSSDRTEEVAMA